MILGTNPMDSFAKSRRSKLCDLSMKDHTAFRIFAINKRSYCLRIFATFSIQLDKFS